MNMQVDYRKIEALNYSSLKLFDDSPIDYFRFNILKEPRERTSGIALLIGSLVDFYLIDCGADEQEFEKRFDDKFALFSGVKSTAQAYYLADVLYKLTVRDTDTEGNCNTDFKTRFKEAVGIVQSEGKYKGKTEDKVLDDFNNTALLYWNELVKNGDKQVVDMFVLDKAKKLVNQLTTHNFTYKIFRKDDIEKLNKVVIQFTLEIEGTEVLCKSELDIIHLDHEKKTIQPYDLKTTYDNDSFEYNFVKNKYYLQQAFYHLAVMSWQQDKPELEGYKILPMQFIVADTSKNNRFPLVYVTDEDILQKGLKGFEYKTKYCKGVEQLLREVAWAFENNMWKCTREVYENNGIVKLSI